MPIKNFVGGDISSVSAAELNRYLIQSAHIIKGSDESRSSTTTPTNDSTLVLQVSANTNYWLVAMIIYVGDTAGDLLAKYTAPSGATLSWVTDALGSGATSTADIVSRTMQGVGSTPGFGAILGSDTIAVNKGLLQVGSSGGSLRFQWAQVTSSATATTVRAGSMLMIRRLTT